MSKFKPKKVRKLNIFDHLKSYHLYEKNFRISGRIFSNLF